MDSRRPPTDLHPPTVHGPWQVVRRISSGGTATVYLARRDGGLAALKVLHDPMTPRDRQRLAREQALLRDIDSPGVVKLAAGPQGDDWTALVLLEGPTLGQALREGSRFPQHAVPWMERLAAGLAALHDAGWSHGDLKPDNVVLTDDGPVLIDLSHAERAAGWQEGSDPSGSFVWCPPERLPHRLVDGRRADVYGLGALLFALHTGRAPVPGEGSHPAIPRSLHLLVRTALAPDPLARPADAHAFQRALRRRPMSDRAALFLTHLAAAAALLLMLPTVWSAPPTLQTQPPEAQTPQRPRAHPVPRASTPPGPRGGLTAALIVAPPTPRPGRTSLPAQPFPGSGDACAPDQARVDVIDETSAFLHGFIVDPSGPVLPLSGCLPTGRPLTLRGAPKGDRVLNVGRVTLAAGATTRLTCSELLGHCRALETS